MRKVIVLFLTLIFGLSVVAPVAATDDTAKKADDLRAFIAKKWPGFFQRMEKNSVWKQSGATGTAGIKSAGVQSAVNSAIHKYEQREYQYQAFIDKLKSRRDKLAADGKDVTKINTLLLRLEARHTELKGIMQTEMAWMNTLDPKDISADTWKEARPHVEKMRKLFKEHQAEMEAVVKAMREQTVQKEFQRTIIRPTGIRKLGVPTGYVVPPPRYKDGVNN